MTNKNTKTGKRTQATTKTSKLKIVDKMISSSLLMTLSTMTMTKTMTMTMTMTMFVSEELEQVIFCNTHEYSWQIRYYLSYLSYLEVTWQTESDTGPPCHVYLPI